MNTETGQIYYGEEQIRKAQERGEPLRELTQEEIRELKTRERDRVERRTYGHPVHKDRSGSKTAFRREDRRKKNRSARRARAKNR